MTNLTSDYDYSVDVFNQTISGVSLHSGLYSKIIFKPNHNLNGIVFRYNSKYLPVNHLTLHGNSLFTSVKNEDIEIRTVEHLLSALSGLSIYNILIDLSSNELPILDGSSLPYLDLLTEFKRRYPTKIHRVKLNKTHVLSMGGSYLSISPVKDDQIYIDTTIKYDAPITLDMPKNLKLVFNESNYIEHVACARTFCFKKDVDNMRKQSLALGGSLKNAIVLDDFSILNTSGLRLENELVAHKVLDLIGDLTPIFSFYTGFIITGYRIGHSFNNSFLKSFYQT